MKKPIQPTTNLNVKSNSRKNRTILIIAGFVLVISTIFILLFVYLGKSTVANIAVPDDALYIEAINSLLPEIQQTTSLKKIEISTYTTEEDLKKVLETSKKNNTLLALIPVDGSFSIHDLTKTDLLHDIGTIPDTVIPRPYMTSLSMVLETDKNYLLPFSVDTWVLLSKKEKPTITPTYKYVIAGKDDKTVFATMSLALLNRTPKNEDVSISNTLEILGDMSNDKTFQPNAATYTYLDAMAFLRTGKATYMLSSLSTYAKLSIQEKIEFTVEPLQSRFITDMTTIAFPALASSDAEKNRQSLIDLFSDSDFQYKFSEMTDSFPAHLIAVSRSAAIDRIRRQISLTDSCIFTAMPFSNEKNPADLLEQIRGKLSTKKINVK